MHPYPDKIGAPAIAPATNATRGLEQKTLSSCPMVSVWSTLDPVGRSVTAWSRVQTVAGDSGYFHEFSAHIGRRLVETFPASAQCVTLDDVI